MPVLRCTRGNAAVEFALVAPVLLALLASSVDFGSLYAQRARLEVAAQAGAEAAAAALSASDLSAPGVPGFAESAARVAVATALGGSLAGVQVSVRWGDAVSQEVQELPRMAMTVRVPRVENVNQDVDTTHTHRFRWGVPTYTPTAPAFPHTFPVSWQDTTNLIGGVATTLRDYHTVSDRFDDYINGLPGGTAIGYGGLGSIYIGGWWAFGGPPYVAGIATYLTDRFTSQETTSVYVQGLPSGNPVTVWKSGMTYPVSIVDRTWLEGVSRDEWGDSDPGGVYLRFRYAVRRPPGSVTFYSEPNMRLVQRRTLVVEAASVFTASNGFTRPLLDGRTVVGRGSAVAVSATPWE